MPFPSLRDSTGSGPGVGAANVGGRSRGAVACGGVAVKGGGPSVEAEAEDGATPAAPSPSATVVTTSAARSACICWSWARTGLSRIRTCVWACGGKVRALSVGRGKTENGARTRLATIGGPSGVDVSGVDVEVGVPATTSAARSACICWSRWARTGLLRIRTCVWACGGKVRAPSVGRGKTENRKRTRLAAIGGHSGMDVAGVCVVAGGVDVALICIRCARLRSLRSTQRVACEGARWAQSGQGQGEWWGEGETRRDGTGRGRTHANNATFSSFVRVSFDPSVGRRCGWVVEPVVPLAAAAPKRSSRRSVDRFVVPFFFGRFVTPPSRGPRCPMCAPVRRLWGSVASVVSKRSLLGQEGGGGGKGRQSRGTHPSHSRRSTLNFFSRSLSVALFPVFPRRKPLQRSWRPAFERLSLERGRRRKDVAGGYVASASSWPSHQDDGDSGTHMSWCTTSRRTPSMSFPGSGRPPHGDVAALSQSTSICSASGSASGTASRRSRVGDPMGDCVGVGVGVGSVMAAKYPSCFSMRSAVRRASRAERTRRATCQTGPSPPPKRPSGPPRARHSPVTGRGLSRGKWSFLGVL